VTSCDSSAGIGASLRTDGHWTDGWTYRRDSGNSILDINTRIDVYFLQKNSLIPFIKDPEASENAPHSQFKISDIIPLYGFF
jgi:hypothetical protein